MVAALAETTVGPILPHLRDIMLAHPEGRQILKERPRINTDTVDMDALARLLEGLFGRSYITWLERTGVTPDTRTSVRVIGVFHCKSLIISKTGQIYRRPRIGICHAEVPRMPRPVPLHYQLSSQRRIGVGRQVLRVP